MGRILAILAQRSDVQINFTLAGILALVAGILLLVWPKLLRYIVAGYLILIGLIEIFDIRI